MRRIDCYAAQSAGVVIDGETAIVSFRTNDAWNDADASVLLSLEALDALSLSLQQARHRMTARQRSSTKATRPGRAGRSRAVLRG